MTTGETSSFDYRTFVGKVMSLLFKWALISLLFLVRLKFTNSYHPTILHRQELWVGRGSDCPASLGLQRNPASIDLSEGQSQQRPVTQHAVQPSFHRTFGSYGDVHYCDCDADTSFIWLLCAKLFQSCPIFCNPVDCSPQGSSVHGILQTRILKWVAIPFSRGSSQLRDQTQVSHIASRFFTIWTTREIENKNTEVIYQYIGKIAEWKEWSTRRKKPLHEDKKRQPLWLRPGVPNLWDLMPDDLR